MASHEDSSGPGCARDGVIHDPFVVPNCATQPGSVDWADQTSSCTHLQRHWTISFPEGAIVVIQIQGSSGAATRTAAKFGVIPRRERNQYKELYTDGSALLDPKPLRSQGAPPKE